MPTYAGYATETDDEEDEVEAILHRIRGLSISSAEKSGLKGRSWLSKLNENLAQWHEEEGMSMTKFKQVVRDHAICLSDLKEYGNRRVLQQVLRQDPSKRVRLAQAKQYKYVEICLVSL